MGVFVAGLDWSGDPGDPAKSGAKPYLVIASAHMLQSEQSLLIQRLHDTRRALNLDQWYVFKYMHAKQHFRNTFFSTIAGLDLSIHINVVDKRRWFSPESSRQPHLLATAIADLLATREGKVLRGMTDATKGALRGQGQRTNFPRLRARPDTNRSDGDIIQVADMFADALRDAEGGIGSDLESFRSRIHFTNR